MDPVLLRALAVAAILVAAVLVGRWWQGRDGEVRRVAHDRLQPDHLADVGLDLAGGEVGGVLLGSPTCRPCDAVKRLLQELSAERRDFRWVYADAADHLGLTVAHRVHRVPTLLLVEPDGRVLARTSGVPRRDELRRVIDHGERIGDTAA